ncbi:type I phosphomannose isomerase catalytic subunit [Aquimarina sp. M1]
MLYPLKFRPILKEKIWGGNKLQSFLNKPTTKGNVGESWEISTVENNISVVSNRELAGKSLTELIKRYKEELVGKRIYDEFGNHFPLLLKFIDAKEDLSVQLHPNDTLAKNRHNSFGKTEMWYVVQADKNAKLIVDFNKKTTKKEYQNYLEKGNIEELLNFENISKGDSYFINAGKIHAIGAGSLIAEIQQTSDITYRVYDWGRLDDQGNARELHTDLALDALGFDSKKDFKLNYQRKINKVNNLIQGTYFTTNYLRIQGKLERNYHDIDSFVVFMCVGGSLTIKTKETFEEIKLGETILIPYFVRDVVILASDAELLEIYS